VPRRDSSNSDPIYLRNSVRGYILPLLKTYNARIVASLGRSARICADEDDLVSQLAEAAWQTVATVEAAGIALDRERFAEQHPALQRRLVRRAVTAVAPDVELEARHLDLALAAIRNGHRRQQLPRAVWIVVDRRRLWITRAP
jgi:tRNA(Ile)-lysidine synthase